jgi:hypothetical protein
MNLNVITLPLLFVCFCARAAHAASADSVAVWGVNYFGHTNVPVEGQSGVTAMAAGSGHTVVLLGAEVPLHTSRNGNELGQRAAAVEMQQQAVTFARGGRKTQFQETLDSYKDGHLPKAY